MSPSSPSNRFATDLRQAGERWLADLGPALSAADPEGRIAPRVRLLSAGLGVLSQLTYQALGGSRASAEVGRAGAELALLTKIDDQVVDGLAFHGGASTDRDELRRKTRAYLAPTLASLATGKAENAEPRCALAADLGRALRALSSDAARLDHLLATIAMGWEVQVEAVAILTSHPSRVTLAQVDAITGRISGAWLLMIALIGTLPGDARRSLTAAEEEAFFAWGSGVQRAGALADLEGDLAEGHLASYPGKLLWESAPAATRDALERHDLAAIYALVGEHEIDRACLLDEEDIALLSFELRRLGEVPALFAWIQGYLADRYLSHPLAAAVSALPFTPRAPEARLFPHLREPARCAMP
ncbi:MAG: hypothetical protein U0359_24930 [Byssovorax sp.]